MSRTPEQEAFWANVERASHTVLRWPAWKRQMAPCPVDKCERAAGHLADKVPHGYAVETYVEWGDGETPPATISAPAPVDSTTARYALLELHEEPQK